MTTAIHLCSPADLETLCALATRRWQEQGKADADADLQSAIEPLLEGGPLGAAYLFGPMRAPVGYLLLGFGWALDIAALEARVLDLYIRPSVRQRGIGTEMLHAVAASLGAAGVQRLRVSCDREQPSLTRLAARVGCEEAPDQVTMTRMLG